MPKNKMNYRKLEIRGPASLNDDERSVEAIGATEKPARIFDYERWEMIDEILLMSGCELPESRQIPLLDSHQRWDTASVIGSYRGMQIEGEKLVGRAHFSSAAEANGPFTKIREGHITDLSVGYRVLQAEWVKEGESTTIQGKVYQGPVKVVTRWQPKEMSIVPIGADDQAKIRSEQRTHNKENNSMNEKLRKALEARGLSAEATEAEAWDFLERLELPKKPEKKEPPVADAVDADAVRAEAIRIERERISEIEAMCKRFDCHEDFTQQLVKDGATIEEARKAVMEHIYSQNYKTPEVVPPGDEGRSVGRIEVIADEKDKFRAAAQDSIMIRAGVRIEKPAPGADELTGYTMRELARHALWKARVKVSGSPLEMIGRALTTSDFPYILANVANKSLLQGWEGAEETWQIWCATGSVADFKTNYLVRASETDDLDEINESAEYKYGDRTESREPYSITTYGKLFALSRQTIINDDLGALTDIPRSHGEAAARKIGDVAYAVLTANAAMGDSIALFHASHSNLASGTTIDPPGITTIGAAILAMKSQTDLQGLKRLNIRPQYFIAPVAMEGASEVLFRSERYVDSDTVATDSSLAATRVNPYAGAYFTRVYEPRLDDDSTTQWYLAAAKGKTVKVFFLNGNQTPYMETKQGWSVDGVEYKVRIDAGAKAVDYRGLYCNAGT